MAVHAAGFGSVEVSRPFYPRGLLLSRISPTPKVERESLVAEVFRFLLRCMNDWYPVTVTKIESKLDEPGSVADFEDY